MAGSVSRVSVSSQARVYVGFLGQVLIGTALCVLTVVTCPVAIEAGDEQPSGVVPPELAEAIRKIDPQAHIVQASEVDVESCGPRSQPGLVVADFNGDGRRDYAVLLRSGRTKEARHPVFGDPYLAAEQWIVVFFDINGRLRQVFTDHHWTYAPSISRNILILQPPSHLRDVSGQGEVTLKHPGIAFVYCESGVRVYYWSPKKRGFTDIQASE